MENVGRVGIGGRPAAWILAAGVAAGIAAPAQAQQFNVFGKSVQVHGSLSQGFTKSDENNFLTAKTQDGTAAMTDAALNASSQLTRKLRVGAQGYVRNIGRLGDGHFELDWAYGDYQFTSWLGVRGGKIKTTLGLYTDTQDMDFLHTWAVLPQSMYPLDLRSSTMAHTGADVYGSLSLQKAGTLAYTAYFGARPDDAHGGKKYVLMDFGFPPKGDMTGSVQGADLRWTVAQSGLLVGASYLTGDYHGEGTYNLLRLPYEVDTNAYDVNRFFANYVFRNLHVDAEFERMWESVDVTIVPVGRLTQVSADQRSAYVSGAYRLSRLLEVGSYHSRYVYDTRKDHALANNHIYDTAVTGRFDFLQHVYVKAEGHFMDGYGSPQSSHGFYALDNPQGLKPKTKLFVLRAGFNF